MSQKYFTHATPTLFNAGTPRPQLSSCFLLAMKEDSIEGIYDTLKRCRVSVKSQLELFVEASTACERAVARPTPSTRRVPRFSTSFVIVSPRRCACISKYAGGIGLSVHNIRATDSYIRGSNGTSNGIVPMLRVYNDTARYVDQGGQISASRRVEAPSRHLHESSPGEQAVGGLFFGFGAVRTAHDVVAATTS